MTCQRWEDDDGDEHKGKLFVWFRSLRVQARFDRWYATRVERVQQPRDASPQGADDLTAACLVQHHGASDQRRERRSRRRHVARRQEADLTQDAFAPVEPPRQQVDDGRRPRQGWASSPTPTGATTAGIPTARRRRW